MVATIQTFYDTGSSKSTITEADIAGEEPSYSIALDNQVAKQGYDVTLSCLPIGYPVPRLTFHRNHVVLRESERITIGNCPSLLNSHSITGGCFMLRSIG